MSKATIQDVLLLIQNWMPNSGVHLKEDGVYTKTGLFIPSLEAEFVINRIKVMATNSVACSRKALDKWLYCAAKESEMSYVYSAILTNNEWLKNDMKLLEELDKFAT